MKIAIAGITGRMGQALARAVSAHPGCLLAAGSERPGFDVSAARAALGAIGHADLPLTDSPATLFDAADAVIDFTAPASTRALAEACARAGKIHVIGTTGLERADQNTIMDAAKSARIVQSANYSLGVTVLEALVEQAARLLSADYDIEVDEMHHRLKKDAPSGTALLLARAAAKGRGVDLDSEKRFYKEGQIGERERGTIGFSVRRGGDVVGKHTVFYAGPGENLELTHEGFSRDIYAHGALKAALWAAAQRPGLYSMRDVVGL